MEFFSTRPYSKPSFGLSVIDRIFDTTLKTYDNKQVLAAAAKYIFALLLVQNYQ